MSAAALLLLLLLLCAALAQPGQKSPTRVPTKKPKPTTEGTFESVATSQTASIGEENKHTAKIFTEITDGSSLASRTQEEAITEAPTPEDEDNLFDNSGKRDPPHPVRQHASTMKMADIFDDLSKEKCSGIQCFDAITLIIIIVAVIIGIFLVIISFVVGRKCCRGSSTQAKYSKIGEMYN